MIQVRVLLRPLKKKLSASEKKIFMTLQEKLNLAMQDVKLLNGEKYLKNIQSLLDQFDNNTKLKILQGVIESGGKTTPLLHDESLEKHFLTKLSLANQSEKKAIISDMINQLSMTDTVLAELRQYKDILQELKTENNAV